MLHSFSIAGTLIFMDSQEETLFVKRAFVLFLLVTAGAIHPASAGVAESPALVDGTYVPLDAAPLRPDCWGVYTWGSTRGVNPRTAPNVVGMPVIVTWRRLEPEPGAFRFDRMIGAKLKAAAENDLYVFIMTWVASPGGATPSWLYDTEGVPKVMTCRGKNPLGKKETPLTFPYYLDPTYRKHYYRLIERFARYINGLPDSLHNRIIFVQSAEGSTGDGQPYKGTPIAGYRRYAIDFKTWSAFRTAAWEQYRKHFMDRPERRIAIVVNADANRGGQFAWMMDNLPYIGVKQGMFTHGWHISCGAERRKEWFSLVKKAELAGKRTFVRGEEDGEMFVYGRMTRNIPRGLYTAALYCLYNGVDCWNVPGKAVCAPENQPAFAFFNKYAGRRDPRRAPAAFCALREGLDAADTKKFPEKRFGRAHRRNLDRYLKIAAAHKQYGAVQGDPDKAIGGGMVNRKRMDYNDVGWKIITGNYYRFLEQIDPAATSIGWWHQGPADSIYSQFARSFRIDGGRGSLLLKLHPFFYGDAKRPVSVRIRVVYLDRGTGRWSLRYAKKGKPTAAYRIENGDSGRWKEKTVDLKNVVVAGALERGADVALRYAGGDTTLFHLVEIDRR